MDLAFAARQRRAHDQLAMMKILSLELSSRRGSIALLDRGEECFVCEFANDRKHSGAFFEKLKEVTNDSDAAELIVVGTGPGSYAGVRIAIAAAIGLAAATGARLIGIPSFCAIPTDAASYLAIGDARRQSFYYAHIVGGECAEGPTLCSEGELRARIVGLTSPVYASEPLPMFEQAEFRAPSASLLAGLAGRGSHGESKAPLEPIYLREPHITTPKDRGLALFPKA